MRQPSVDFLKAFLEFKKVVPMPQKNKINKYHGNRYAGLDDVYAAITPHLNNLGLTILENKTYINDDLYLVLRLFHVDSGDYIEDAIKLKEAVKMQDLGGQITYARRYGIQLLCGIVADEDDDGNLASGLDTKADPPLNNTLDKKQVMAKYARYIGKLKLSQEELNEKLKQAMKMTVDELMAEMSKANGKGE